VEIETLTMPPFPGNLVIHDKQAYLKTLRNLNAWKQQDPEAALIPTHCMRAFNQFQRPLHVV
jgi:hypothetical protein